MTLKELIAKHAYTNVKIISYARHLTQNPNHAEELIQDTAFYLIEKPRVFQYRTENHFIRFFMIAMKRRKLNLDRREKRILYTDRPLPTHTEAPFTEDLETQDIITKALSLYENENVKEILDYYFFKGFNTREISEELQMNINTVCGRLIKGYRDLKNIIEQRDFI